MVARKKKAKPATVLLAGVINQAGYGVVESEPALYLHVTVGNDVRTTFIFKATAAAKVLSSANVDNSGALAGRGAILRNTEGSDSVEFIGFRA